MGLDAVELLMEFEDQFGIVIPDAAASQMQTVGDVYAYLLRQAGPTTAAPACSTQHAFHTVRRELVDCGIGREAVSPNALLASLIPVARRRNIWRKLSLQLSGDLPMLRLPIAVSVVIGGLVLSLVSISLWATFESGDMGALAGLIGVPFVWLICLGIAYPLFGRQIPATCSTVEALVLRVAAVQERRAVLFGSPDAAMVWRELTKVIGTFLGIDPKEIAPDTHFITDLGLD